jgi:RNA polymerase sigma-70 factor (ECF subfamily)
VPVADAAPDVASETWLQAARDIRDFRGDAGGFRVWLFRVARNRGLEELRRAGRGQADPLDHDNHPGIPDAAEEALDRLDADWALTVIATLPKDQAEAVMLRVVAGLDVAQTAAVLGKRPGAVRVATMRGLRRLAEHVEVKARREADARTRRWAVGAQAPRPEGV